MTLLTPGVQQEKSSLPFISSLLDSVVPRAKSASQKRKRDEGDDTHPLFPPTQLDELVLNGMQNEQIWQQLELRTSKLSRVLDTVMTSTVGEDEDEEESDDDSLSQSLDHIPEEDSDEEWEDEAENSADEGFAGASDLSDVDPDEVFYEPLHSEDEQQKRKAEKEREEMMNMYGVTDPALFQALMQEAQGDGDEDEDEDEDAPAKSVLDQLDDPNESAASSKRRHPTLDDDFFSIDEFNRMTEAEERRSNTSRANLSGDDEDEDDDEIDLFASVDDADDSEDEDEDEDEDEMSAADITYANFFDPPKTAPKSQKKGRAQKENKVEEPQEPERKTLVRFHDQVRVRPIKKCRPRGQIAGLLGDGEDEEEDEDEEEEEDDDDDDEEDDDEEEEEEVEDEIGIDHNHDAMDENEEDEDEDEDEDEEDEEEDEEEDDEEDVDLDEADEDDLDADLDDDALSESELGEDAQADATAVRVAGDLFADEEPEQDTDYLSAHERRMAELNEEIARYEDENVQKKDWTLMGEATSRERPSNSLLEEDLEFERTAKNTPTITQEHTEGIEGMIKRRILDRQFDDVIRQRDIDALPFAPSKMLDLSDAKSSKSLAELYEDEYQAARGDEDAAPVSESDAKLANEHQAIARDLDSLFNKLDALSNAHYTPKAPKAAIETISNTSSIAMESALPTTQSTGTMLAPEEVYAASSHAPAMAGAKSEMTPAEKRRQHNQLRQAKRKRNERMRRAEDAIAVSRGAPRKEGDKAEKDKALKSLLGNKGVSVVGKDSKRQGVKEAVTGKKDKGKSSSSGAQYKL